MLSELFIRFINRIQNYCLFILFFEKKGYFILFPDQSPLYALADDGKELCVEDNFEGFVFRAVRHRIVLLPEEQYASFFVLLTTRSFILSTWVGSVLDIFNRKYFIRLLLSILLPNHDLLMSFIEVIIREQIKRETGLVFLNLHIY